MIQYYVNQHFLIIGIRAIQDIRIVPAARKALKLIGRNPGTILDIGCGHGVFVLLAHLQGHSISGIDTSE